MSDVPEQEKPKRKKGFASMSIERRRELASIGGKAAHAQGVAHKWTPEEASEAGKKGGKMTQQRLRERLRERVKA